jgi:cellulose biosynthesis protein BcsQ
MSYPVITVLANKGGCGKTTVIGCLAAEFHIRELPVALVDTDPSQNLTNWVYSGEDMAKIETHTDSSEKVLDKIEELSKDKYVLVDTAGFKNRTAVLVANRADKIIEELNQDKEKKSDVSVVMTQATRATIVSHIRNDLTKAGAKVLGCEIGNRTIYAEANLLGTAPSFSQKANQKAANEIAALGTEVLRGNWH